MKVSIYVRVSTKEQTVLNQEIILKEYCIKNNYELYEIYKDEGISGSKTSRPGLDKMLQDMRKGLFTCIIVWKLDRLGRSVQHLLQILQELQNKKVRLICTDMNIDTYTPQGKFFFTVVGAFAELERGIIRDRINLGLDRARTQGIRLGRPEGSKDKGKRRKSGYWLRWDKEKKENKQTTNKQVKLISETKVNSNHPPIINNITNL